MALLATKLKNTIHRIDPAINCSHLKNVSVNGAKVGCEGFVLNPVNSRIAYVSTDTLDGSVLYRAARDMRDFTGGPNMWAKPDRAAGEIVRMLAEWDEAIWSRHVNLANKHK